MVHRSIHPLQIHGNSIFNPIADKMMMIWLARMVHSKKSQVDMTGFHMCMT